MIKFSQPHILIFEPRVEGHNLIWLRYITEDPLTAGFRLTLAVDYRPESKELIQNRLSLLINEVAVISVFNEAGKLRGGSKLKALGDCLNESGAQEAFMPNFDEIASHCLRSAAAGFYPPKLLQGRLNGVYFRPRFLANSTWPFGNIIKAFGFRRLCQQLWFKNIYLMDEYLFATNKDKYPRPIFHFLPDPWSGAFSYSQQGAQKALRIPSNKLVLLNYGIGTRRKGLHLVVNSMLKSSPDSQLFLLCAGQIAKDPKLTSGLDQLKKWCLAKVMNRYVSDFEEKLCFCASDVVLLPYIKHFGSSGVLSRAAAAGKMVIASDEELLGQRVREHKLGWVFPSGNIKELKKCMDEATLLKDSDLSQFRQSALCYANSCSREAFRKALLSSYRI
jgi:glycosyltransferase involved in cell wall biosynthesis